MNGSTRRIDVSYASRHDPCRAADRAAPVLDQSTARSCASTRSRWSIGSDGSSSPRRDRASSKSGQRASRRLLAERQIALPFERGRQISPALLAVAGARERGAPQLDELVEVLPGRRKFPVLQHDVAEPFEHDRQVAGVVEAARIAVVDPRQEIARALEFRQRLGPASRHGIEHVAMARGGLREAPLCAVVVWRRSRLGLEHGDGRRLIRERLLVALALEQELGAIGQRGRPLGRRSRQSWPPTGTSRVPSARRSEPCAPWRDRRRCTRVRRRATRTWRRNPAGPPAPPARALVRAATRSRDRSPCCR